VLTLVVGGPTPVPAVAVNHDLPRGEAGAPAFRLAEYDVAVAVHQHRGEGIVLVAVPDQERTGAGHGVLHDGRARSKAVQGGRDLVGEVAVQDR